MLTNVLVVGGAGYIGSHMVDFLKRENINPIVLDNLSTGHRHAVTSQPFFEGDMRDEKLLDEIFLTQKIDAVMHFASFIQVGESVKDPIKYYQNNVAGTLHLLQAMLKHNIKYFIFSSTAAVYGEPSYSPIDEAHDVKPINPYGHSKKMVEQILQDFSFSHGLKFMSLRYFNAAGAHPDGHLHENHEPETHLIPLVLRAAVENTAITIFGNDYSTPDGTCVRDYIHVNDLCSAHFLALKKLMAKGENAVLNLGTGQGYSVQQVVDAAKKITQRDIKVIYGDRRCGDPAVLVANADRAKKYLNWEPEYSELETIIVHAWQTINPS